MCPFRLKAKVELRKPLQLSHAVGWEGTSQLKGRPESETKQQAFVAIVVFLNNSGFIYRVFARNLKR